MLPRDMKAAREVAAAQLARRRHVVCCRRAAFISPQAAARRCARYGDIQAGAHEVLVVIDKDAY